MRYIHEIGRTRQNKERELSTNEAEYVLEGMHKIPVVEMIATLPSLIDWLELKDSEKPARMREVLEGELHTQAAKYGDHRTQPSKDDSVRTPYHNLIFPWLGQYYQVFGKDKFDRAIVGGKVDVMVKELREMGVLRPETDLDSAWVSLASSTGTTPNLWQYDQGLQMLEKMREATKSDDWVQIKNKLSQIQSEQDKLIKRQRGYAESDIIVRMQSGTELTLLNGLLGSSCAQVTDETGTNTVAAASMRHTSELGYMGHKRKKSESGEMPRLQGFEESREAFEVHLRDPMGEYRDSEDIKIQTQVWIEKMREQNPGCRLTLTVTAGGKTGIGWDAGGLRFKDALELRNTFGGKDRLGILIVVDNSQGRLEESVIDQLKGEMVMIDETDSKYYEGGMFSAFRYIPKEYVELAREYILRHGMPEGFKEYVVQSDLKELLLEGEEVGSERYLKLLTELNKLPDMPDIFSVLKWQAPTMAIEKCAPKTVEDRKNRALLVRDYAKLFAAEVKLLGKEAVAGKMQAKLINGHTWEVKLLQELPWDKFNPKAELLSSIQLYVDGKLMTEKQMKAVQFKMGMLGKSGKMVQIGQFVQRAFVIRPAPGLMTEYAMRKAWEGNVPQPIIFEKKLVNVITNKLTEVMEETLLEMSPKNSVGEIWSKDRRQEWRFLAAQARDMMKQVEKLPSLPQKVEQIVKMYKDMLVSTDLKPVVLISGKHSVALDLMYQAWVRSGRGQHDLYKVGSVKGEHLAEDLPIAYIDHPYATISKGGKKMPASKNVYSTIAKTLVTYPHTHLYIWGAGEDIRQELIDAGLENRFTVCSERAPLTRFEQNHPHWYRKRDIFLGEDGQKINEQHKANQTREIVDYFMEKYKGDFFALVRGNNPNQIAREHTAPINIAQNNFFLGFHPTFALTQEEVIEWANLLELPITKNYFDWLKEAGKGACGIENTLVWER